MKDKIIELIKNSDLVQMQKNVFAGFVERASEKDRLNKEDRELIKSLIYEKHKLSDIIISTDEVKIYTVSGNDEWDVKYPFRSIYKDNNGRWIRVATVSSSLDLAFLNYLEEKHLSSNSNFVNFAIKMLEIKLED